MRYEKSDEPVVAMKDKPMTLRTCIDGCRGRLSGREKLDPAKGFWPG
ncbi:MAG: hypothetical protein Q8O41_08500 [Candidatus Methanoperedens sp.]|nr:hypothetical protein [Candidatus Methanoperedens sp.]